MKAEKIEVIRKYLQQNGVEYYDIQAELIDHFATSVENVQREKPGIGFVEALHLSHKKFGGQKGFMKYTEQARKDVQKKPGCW